MRRISNPIPFDGLEIVNTEYPQTRYLVSKKFVMVEFDVDKGKEFISVYLRPYDKDKTLIIAYLPEFEYLEDLRIYNQLGLLQFLSRSKSISELYKNASKLSEKPFLSKEHDFTEIRDAEVWCIQKIVNLELTPKIINEAFSEFKTLEKGVNEIVAVVSEFLEIRREHLSDFNSVNWIRHINPSLVKSVINRCEQDGFWGTLFHRVDDISDVALREYVQEKKVVMWCKNHVYAIGDMIDEEDKKHDAKVIIMADIFDTSFKNSGYMFCIDLAYTYGDWKPITNLGELIEDISIMLNHVNTKAWARIEDSAFKYMPKASEMWYYSNPYHEGTMIRKFMQDGDRSDYEIDDPVFVVKEPDCLVGNAFVNIQSDDPWNDLKSFSFVSSILNSALTIVSEFQRYYPIWKRKSILEVVKKSLVPTINPSRYILKKMFGLDNK